MRVATQARRNSALPSRTTLVWLQGAATRMTLTLAVLVAVGSGLVQPAVARSSAKAAVKLTAKPSGSKLTLTIKAAPRASCTAKASAGKKSTSFPPFRTSGTGRATLTWTVPDDAPSGAWMFAAHCRSHGRAASGRASIVLVNHGSGNGDLVEPSSGQLAGGGVLLADGRGGGQSCAPDTGGRSVCFTNNPFGNAGYAGECTWYASGRRPDLYGIVRGNAKNWLNEARGKVVEGTVPVPGAVAVSTAGDYGHVAYVIGVADGGATVIVDESNYARFHTVSYGRRVPANKFAGYIYGGPAGDGTSSGPGSPAAGPGASSPVTPQPGYFGALLTDGTFAAKQGIHGAWVTETNNVKQIAIGSSSDRAYVGAVLTDGTFVAKQGVGGEWITETTNVAQIAIGGQYIGVIDGAGTFMIKQGIGGGWVTETNNVKQIAIADGPDGPYIGALLTDGTFAAKQGIYGGWVTETTNVKQIAIASGPDGPYIGALLTDGTFAAKQGIYGGWITETTNVAQIAIGGQYIGVIDGAGTFMIKQGIGGGWVTETNNVKQIAIADGPDGPYIGALLTDGTFAAKQGIYGGWVTETNNVKQIAIAP
jgi:surface antigen